MGATPTTGHQPSEGQSQTPLEGYATSPMESTTPLVVVYGDGGSEVHWLAFGAKSLVYFLFNLVFHFPWWQTKGLEQKAKPDEYAYSIPHPYASLVP